MITSSAIALTLSLITGLMAGGLFFTGLWFTVNRIATARHPGMLMAFSFVIRVAIVLGAFFLVGRAHFDRMLLCLVGFVIARLLVMRFTRDRGADKLNTGKETPDAAES